MRQSKRGPGRRRDKDKDASSVDDPQAETKHPRDLDRRPDGYISEIELCRGLPYEQVESILERCPVETLEPGEVLLEPGQANHHLYFLLSGALEVRLKSVDSPPVDVIKVGECTGEMSIIDGLPTSAYVIATQQSTVIAVHGNIFWSKIATNPTVVRNLSRVLAERMRKRNDATLRALEKEIRLEQLQRELLAAFEIQNGMLPQGPALLPELPSIDIHARMDVVKSVGGDFYDAFRLDDRRVCIAIGDVSGKGMPAALFMVRTVTLLRAELVKTGTLAECVNRFNSALCDTSLSHMFVSLVVMRIDLIDGAIEYVNAGHPPMLVSHGGDPYIPVDDSQGLIAGVLADNIYHGARTHLNSGDRIVLYTDGVTEARNTSRGFYGQQRLIDFLSACDNRDSAGEVSRIFDDIQSFSDKALQSDDITVIAVTYGGG